MDLKLPSSKSLAHRYLIAAALSDRDSEVVIDGIAVRDFEGEPSAAWSDDVRATYRCLTAMKRGEGVWPCRESGTTLRLLTPVARMMGWRGEFRMEGRLAERPQWPDDLWETGSDPFLRDGKRRFRIPGGVSSQFVSGLLMALPLSREGGVIEIDGRLESAHYVELTLGVLREAGIIVRPMDSAFCVDGGQRYRLSGRVVVPEDPELSEFYDVLMSNKGRPVLTDFDCADIPDSVPVLAARAAAREGTVTRFRNCGRLRLKESDRLEGMVSMINAVGGRARIEEDGTTLTVEGRSLAGGRVATHNDHRLVFAAAVLRAFAAGEVLIDEVGPVRKSFPAFLKPKLFLYGPPGSGKTTEGRRIAAAEGRVFADLDEEIVREAGMSVPEIFAAEGEAGFRRREKAMLRRLVALPGAVIALGGGTLLDGDNLKLVRNEVRVTGGELRVLDAPAEVLWERIRSDGSRPLAQSRVAFERLLEARAAHYLCLHPNS